MEELQTQVNPRLKASTGGFAYSAAAVCLIVVMLIFSSIISAVPEYGYAYWFLNFLGSPIAIALAVAATLKLHKISVKDIFPVKCKPKYYLIGLLLIFGLFFSLNQINALFLKLFGLDDGSEYTLKLEEFLMSLNGGWIVLALVVIAAIPAFFEEVLFRGVILNNCRTDMGGLRSVLVVGFCFALLHGSPEQTVYQFIAGCLFAFVALRSGSIIPGIIMHFLNNALVIILAVTGAMDDSGFMFCKQAHIALMVVGAAALAAGLLLLIFDKKPLGKCGAGAVKSFFVYAALGIVVLSVVWIINLVALI